MTRIAVTGHLGLPAQTAAEVDKSVRDLLAQHDASQMVGVSCLAGGTDQIFAQAVLDFGGRLEAIVVPAEYRNFDDGPGSPFTRLLAQAHRVQKIPTGQTRAQSWTRAGVELLRGADLLVAVWDGRPPGGYGGTADVATEALRRGMPVRVIWPDTT